MGVGKSLLISDFISVTSLVPTFRVKRQFGWTLLRVIQVEDLENLLLSQVIIYKCFLFQTDLNSKYRISLIHVFNYVTINSLNLKILHEERTVKRTFCGMCYIETSSVPCEVRDALLNQHFERILWNNLQQDK